jgi:uncharacterized protein (TIGR03083 family)
MSWWWMSPWSGATGCRHARLFLMEAAVQLQTAAEDARSLLAAARTDWGRPVPQCPGWDAADLVRHMGGILVWMAAVVTSGERVSRRTLDPGPADPADLPRWYLASLDRTLDVLGSAGPGSGTWTFSSIGDRRVAWWNRRLAVEVAIHRWDAQDAVAAAGGPSPDPLDGDVAAAGIEEFMIEFLPGLLAQQTPGELSGTLHLHATDGPTEWWIDLEAGGPAVPGHIKADTAVRGTRSDLLLWLTNRRSPDSLEVLGRKELLGSWTRLRR